MQLSVIVPFHRHRPQLERCLAALSLRRPEYELIVVADGAVEDCRLLVARASGTLVEIDGPRGPAVARNRGAAMASGDLLVFVDSDVVVPPENFDRLVAMFAAAPTLHAVFGAYDEEPADPGFVSQYKNLAHSFVHQSSEPVSRTFWAGFGAVRRSAFLAVGGFDERFERPSMEDVDFGYRLSAAGYQIRLEHELRVCHLKRWTLTSLVEADVLYRGIPWTQLILREGRAENDLNLRTSYRVAVVLAYLTVALVVAAVWYPWLLVPATLSLAGIVGLNLPLYRFFLSRRGLLFTIGVVPLQLLYHLYNGISFVVGSLVFFARRWTGVRVPWAIPQTRWNGPLPPVDPARVTRPR